MWKWLSRYRSRNAARAHGDFEAARQEALIARLVAENQELRAIVVQLDAAVTDLSIQLWGKAAYDRAVAKAASNGNN